MGAMGVQPQSSRDPSLTQDGPRLVPKGAPLVWPPWRNPKSKKAKIDLKWIQDGDLELKRGPNEPTQLAFPGPILFQEMNKSIY